MSKRIYNFSAGPAVLPESVLERARQDIHDYCGTGIGVMELSHRSQTFTEILDDAKARAKQLLNIPDTHEVLFIPGGATQQNSMLPLNFARRGTPNYIVTGVWAKKSWQEAARLASCHVAATSEEERFSTIPRSIALSATPGYLHFTSNNTVYGTQFHEEPEAEGIALICDASSDLFSKPIDVSKYSLIYASAQKNFGIAGITMTIIEKALVEDIPDDLPLVLDYRTYLNHNSAYNTPPTFPIYITREVLRWIDEQGGVSFFQSHNQNKATLLYDIVDSSEFYLPIAAKADRSNMNVAFTLANTELLPRFVSEAKKCGLSGLAGHRLLGGIRASIYNACTLTAVQALATFMKEFEARHG